MARRTSPSKTQPAAPPVTVQQLMDACLKYASTQQAPPPTTSHLVTLYLEDVWDRVKETTWTAYQCVLKPFVARFGREPVDALKASEVEKWAGSMKWSLTTRRYALTVVNGVMKWGIANEHLTANPLHALKKPPARSRGADILIDTTLHARLLAVVSVPFRQFLTAVRGTGARPGEVARVEALHCVWDASCWILADHKTATKTGRERVIHLPADVLELCRTLAQERPTGPLFRTTRGLPWRKESWKQAMARAQKKLGLTKRPMTSGYRHQMATDLLEAGVPDTHCAELLGHRSTAMIVRHYGHLSQRSRVLAEAVRKVRGKAGSTPNSQPHALIPTSVFWAETLSGG